MNKALILLFVLLPVFAFSKKTYTIEIIVLHEFTGEPLEGIQVYLNGKTSDEMITDIQGRYVIKDYKKAKVKIALKHENYREKTWYIDSKELGDNTELVGKLRPSKSHLKEFFDTWSRKEREKALKEAQKIDTLLVEPCDSLLWLEADGAGFPGSAEMLMHYISASVEYPEASIEMEDQGKVFLSFVIEPDGSVSNITVVKGVTKELDREAKRVIREMPKWVPGYCNGRSARIRATLPIVFTLQ